ncbi:MAG TPA: hypothetical protein VFW07_26600 [Parafilimonas sp.]|nr:hypothetical protein [Parafilimonas sp.]
MGSIHNKYYLNEFISGVRNALANEINKLEITESTDIGGLIQKLKREYTIEPLCLEEPKPSEPKEAFETRENMFREQYKQKVYQIKVTIPFQGNEILFQCHPSSCTVVYLDKSVHINSNTITATITLIELNAEKYHEQLSKIMRDVSVNIPMVNAEIAPWNNNLENQIRTWLHERKGVVAKKFDFMEKIGLKVNPKSTEFMIPPSVTKKTIPVPVTETAKHIRKEVIPTLQDEVYNDIKEVLYNVGKAIERKPSIYLSKHEEDLRDIFLLFLETRYDSTSGVGEAFNKKGKTDILLKYSKDGSNLFVAECKFWRGQKSFHEAIDQLLGYLTYRDSKTALILFVDQKEFKAVIEGVKEKIKNHPCFKRYITETYESSISYEFSLPDDSLRIIKLEVILFHYPSLK